jgi:hypothetical protein
VDLDRVQAKQQVLAEATGRDLAARSALVAAIRRTSTFSVRDEPTRSSSPSSTTRSSLPAAETDVRDLVEEQRAAVGRLEAADAVGFRIGECAAHVAEHLGLEHAVGDAAHVDLDQRRSARCERRWIRRATTPLPLPFSPRISTFASVGATRSISDSTAASRASRR